MRPEASDAGVVWPRFRAVVDTFACHRMQGIIACHTRPIAERAVDLFHALAEQMSPAVSVAMVDERTGVRYEGGAVALDDVRTAIARLKPILAQAGGTSVTLWSDRDQLSLTPMLDVWCASRSDRWAHVLLGKGLRAGPSVAPRSWHLTGADFAPSPDASRQVQDAAGRLGLDRR